MYKERFDVKNCLSAVSYVFVISRSHIYTYTPVGGSWSIDLSRFYKTFTHAVGFNKNQFLSCVAPKELLLFVGAGIGSQQVGTGVAPAPISLQYRFDNYCSVGSTIIVVKLRQLL